MNNKKILRYRIKYQDNNVAIIRFPKKEIANLLTNSVIYTEMGENYLHFWKCFDESLLEIPGVLYIMAEGYEMIVVKDPCFPNWGRIIENVIWSSLLFVNPDGGAIEVSKSGDKIGKLITQKFDANEPNYRRKKY